jgi:RNA polymerase sigma-70 factor (ECF subfamily)
MTPKDSRDGSGDLQTVRRVLAGEVEAFADLVARHQRPIYNLMRRAAGSRQEADDLTQEAFLRAYGKLRRFTPGREFFPWLYALSLNVLRDHLRRRPRPTLSLDAMETAAIGPEDAAGPGGWADSIALRQALSRLPLEMREAVLLYYREQWRFPEIAETLGLSVSAAKMRVRRGIARLRQLLEEGHDHRS